MKSDPGADLLDDAAVAGSTQPGAAPLPVAPRANAAWAAGFKALRLAGLVLTTLLYLAAASLLALLIVRIGADLYSGIDPLMDEARRPRLRPSQLAARELAVDVLRQVLIAALVVGVVVARDRSGWRRTLALARPAEARAPVRRLWLFFLVWPLIHIVWVSATAEFFHTSLGHGVHLSPALTPLAIAIWLAYVALLAPVAEELLLRGEAFSRASGFLRPASAIVATAGLFAFAHISEFGLARPISLLPLAIALGWLRWRTGRLWLCIALHAWSNLATLVWVLAPGEG